MSASVQQIADLNGRPLGKRALRKRQLILDAARFLLGERGLRELRVADIAREVGASPATFYQYFADVEDVVLHLAAEANEEMPQLLELFEGTWRGAAGREAARQVAVFFMEHWERHGPVLRIRNLAADEGDLRFMELRRAAMEPVLAAMVALMQRCNAGGADDGFVPGSAALAMSAILDRLAAYQGMVLSDGGGREDIVSTSAHILYRTLTGR